MTNPRNNYQLRRSVGMTYYAAGATDLEPGDVYTERMYWEILEDFHADSYEPQPAHLQDWPVWAPAYMPNESPRSKLQADLLVINLQGWRLQDVEKMMRRMDLSSVMYEAESSSPSAPAVRLVLILDRPVDEGTYADLWEILSMKVFNHELIYPGHDIRQRFCVPRLQGEKWCARFTDGSPLAVDAVLRLRKRNAKNIAWVSQASIRDFWKPGSPVADY
jgi:hypothetical protein